MVGAADSERVAELFHAATKLAAQERTAFVCRESQGDDELAGEVMALLAVDRPATQMALQSPLRAATCLFDGPGEPASGSGAAPLMTPGLDRCGFGPYRLLEEIGEGGMGRVYRAEQESPIRRAVAIKVMKRRADSVSGRARFRAEQQVLARLHHRGIARVLDGGHTSEGRPFLVMDLVDGVPLGDWIRAEQPDLDARLDMFLAMCEAVQHAHQKGVIHRDLNPSNVLVIAGEEGPEPRLIDFGIARVVTTDGGEETLHTGADVAMGTGGYMSPEQAADAAGADARSDVYALGAILYEMLTGVLPRGRVREVHADGWLLMPERPSKRGGADGASASGPNHASEDLDWVVLRALAIEPERRYATVHGFASDVVRARRFEPVSARSPTWTYVGARFLRRHRFSTAVAAAAIALLVVGSVALFALWQEADRNWNDYRRLVDDKRLLDLQAQARDDLWPAWPSTIAAMDRWRERVWVLGARRSDVALRTEQLQQRLLAAEAGVARDELAFQQEVLQRLLRGIDDLLGSESADHNLAGVMQRRALAERVGKTSLVIAKQAWRDVIDAIADVARLPVYAGLQLPGPQVGLVPLGPDPASGLYEFWHVESGERPRVRESYAGEYAGVEMEEQSGMVFVLVPGGRFTMGALLERDAHSGTAPIDPQAAPMERFVHDLTLAPFFVSKYEMTQGQWQRLTGENPSFFSSQRESRGHRPDLRWPVEQVTWPEANRCLQRRGLALPTEVQWEYFARAATVTVFGGVRDVERLPEYANLADEGSRGMLRAELEAGYDDGYAMAARVGAFLPNPWGLHDCHGNVSEWCRDWLLSYQRPTQADGYRVAAAGDQATLRVMRGGDFAERKRISRVASRNAQPPSQRTARTGLRAVRAILPSGS